MTFQIGSLKLDSNLFLAPLAGYTNLPFRLIIREIGGVGLCTTDLVNARSLLEKNRKSLKLIETRPSDHPLAVQLYGSVAEEMRDAAQLLASLGVSAVDVNMGCPVRKICSSGGGSAMMGDHEKAVRVVSMMVKAVQIPVTCKMRLGWDETNLTAPDLARALEDVGVAAVTVHGRTRRQGFDGRVNLAGIRAVVRSVRSMPVIGNGDVTTPSGAKVMFEQTGCAAISIGRGAFYNPWIFRHCRHHLETGELPSEPSFEERIAVMTRHLDRMIEVFGENVGCRMFRKVAMEYSSRFGPVAEFNRRVVRLNRRDEFDEIVVAYRRWRAQFLDENQQLRACFSPRRLGAFFDGCETADGEGGTATRSGAASIPVPAGPNELW